MITLKTTNKPGTARTFAQMLRREVDEPKRIKIFVMGEALRVVGSKDLVFPRWPGLAVTDITYDRLTVECDGETIIIVGSPDDKNFSLRIVFD